MGSDDLHFRSISDMGSMLRRKALSPVELTRAHLERIDALGERLGAFITVMGRALWPGRGSWRARSNPDATWDRSTGYPSP